MSNESPIRAEVTIDRPLHYCCDMESSRYALAAVQVSPSSEDGRVWVSACDSRVLAVVKQDGKTDAPHLLPGEFAKPGKGKVNASLNGVWTVASRKANGASDGKPARIAPETEGRFPQCRDVLPNPDGGIIVSLDAELLFNLARAIGDGKVTLIIQDTTSAISVLGAHGIGVAMPLSITDRNEKLEAAQTRIMESYKSQRADYVRDCTPRM